MLALRLIVRRAIRRPATSLATVGLVAVSLSVTTSLFSLVDAVFLKPLPVSGPDRLVLLKMRRLGQPDTTVSYADLERFRQLPAFRGVEGMGAGAEEGGDVEEGVRYVSVTPGLFPLLGVTPMLGPGFVAGLADESGVILGYDLWRRLFGADPQIVGRSVRLSGETVTVAGVMPPGFSFPYGANLWKAPAAARSNAKFAFLAGVARLAPSVSRDLASSMVPSVSVRSLDQAMRPHGAFTLLFLFVATVLTALVTWGQVALLQLAAAVEQTTEYAVRVALGASRKHLAVESLVEGLLLALASVAVGWWLVPAVTATVAQALPPELLQGREVVADGRALLFALTASLAGVLVCSIASSRLAASPPLADALRARRIMGGSRSATAVRSLLLVMQVAVTAALLYVTAISVESLGRVSSVDLGFETEGRVSVRLRWSADLIRNREAGMARFRSTVGLLREATGATGAAGTDTAPLTRGSVVAPASRSPEPGAAKANARLSSIRLSLGAPPVVLVLQLIASSFGLTALGVSIGLAAGLAIADWSSSIYYGVKALDGTAICVVICVFAILTGLSCVRPAWRAITVNPASVLRSE